VAPHAALAAAVQALVQEAFEGRPFAAVHWARGDFEHYCRQAKDIEGYCQYEGPQAAVCIVRTLQQHNIRFFLATNGNRNNVRASYPLMRSFVPFPAVPWMRSFVLAVPRCFRLPEVMLKLPFASARLGWLGHPGKGGRCTVVLCLGSQHT